jgi:hypothetical protein
MQVLIVGLLEWLDGWIASTPKLLESSSFMPSAAAVLNSPPPILICFDTTRLQTLNSSPPIVCFNFDTTSAGSEDGL